ncbi:MAG: transketolase family protein [Oscillospiraceae bacterium]|jgi:transketolase|nr:transketolase family protein [Oscillospiraceae bacterium]
MSYSVLPTEEIKQAKTLMRDAFCGALTAAAEKNPRVTYLDADLASAFGMTPFFKAFPDRAIDCGIQEADMVGVAAGLSLAGQIPFAHSFGCFTTRRAADQVMLSCLYGRANVRLIGSDPGITASHNGGTHMPFEDIGVLRSMPGITILDLTDPVLLADIVAQLSGDKYYGTYYMRFPRKSVSAVYAEGSTFEIGKGNLLREGGDVTLIACGIMVAEAILAAAILEAEGISARVVDMFTIKPVDRELIAESAQKTGCIVTAENHNEVGGLFAAVAETCAALSPVPIEAVGTGDRFGQVGSEGYLKQEYGLTAEEIAAKAKRAVERKG